MAPQNLGLSVRSEAMVKGDRRDQDDPDQTAQSFVDQRQQQDPDCLNDVENTLAMLTTEAKAAEKNAGEGKTRIALKKLKIKRQKAGVGELQALLAGATMDNVGHLSNGDSR